MSIWGRVETLDSRLPHVGEPNKAPDAAQLSPNLSGLRSEALYLKDEVTPERFTAHIYIYAYIYICIYIYMHIMLAF